MLIPKSEILTRFRKAKKAGDYLLSGYSAYFRGLQVPKEAHVAVIRPEEPGKYPDAHLIRFLLVDCRNGVFPEEEKRQWKQLASKYPKLKGIRLCVKANELISFPGAMDDFLQTPFGSGIQSGINVDLGTIPQYNPEKISEVFNALSGVLAGMTTGAERVMFHYSVNAGNCYFADDILLLSSPDFGTPILFNTDFREKTDFTREQYFHTLMFFEKLSKDRRTAITLRQFYGHIAAGFSNVKTPPQREMQLLALSPDLLLSPELKDLNALAGQLIKKKFFRKAANSGKFFGQVPYSEPTLSSPKTWNKVLITGWYGTETQGDKAILGELLHVLKAANPDCRIAVSSINEWISIQTRSELIQLAGSEIVPLRLASSTDFINTVDAVIIGGGPLMESSSMVELAKIFSEASRQKKARIVFGCGLGPIHSDKVMKLTAEIVRLASGGFVRDENSLKLANELAPGNPLRVACDPAIAFVRRWRYLNKEINKTDNLRIGVFLRANTNEFSPETEQGQLASINQNSAKRIASLMEGVCSEMDATLHLLHMNAPWIGGDDRMFNRLVEAEFKNKERVHAVRSYLTLDDHLHYLATMDYSIAMRYHGHIFSMSLGIPFISIDYTGKKGKVDSLVSRIGYSDWSQTWDQMDLDHAGRLFEKLRLEKVHLSGHLFRETDRLVEDLYKVYQEVWDLTIPLEVH